MPPTVTSALDGSAQRRQRARFFIGTDNHVHEPTSPAARPGSTTPDHPWPTAPSAGGPQRLQRLQAQRLGGGASTSSAPTTASTSSSPAARPGSTTTSRHSPPAPCQNRHQRFNGSPLGRDSRRIFFIDHDNHVHELYLTAGAGWVYNDLTALARAVPPTPTTALDGYPLSDDSKHVNFIGTDNHVHELYFTAGAGWVDNDLTALT